MHIYSQEDNGTYRSKVLNEKNGRQFSNYKANVDFVMEQVDAKDTTTNSFKSVESPDIGAPITIVDTVNNIETANVTDVNSVSTRSISGSFLTKDKSPEIIATAISSFTITEDGKYIYLNYSAEDTKLYQYKMIEPFKLATASYVAVIELPIEFVSLAFSPNGKTCMAQLGIGWIAPMELHLETPWDLNGTITVGHIESDPSLTNTHITRTTRNMAMSKDGKTYIDTRVFKNPLKWSSQDSEFAATDEEIEAEPFNELPQGRSIYSSPWYEGRLSVAYSTDGNRILNKYTGYNEPYSVLLDSNLMIAPFTYNGTVSHETDSPTVAEHLRYSSSFPIIPFRVGCMQLIGDDLYVQNIDSNTIEKIRLTDRDSLSLSGTTGIVTTSAESTSLIQMHITSDGFSVYLFDRDTKSIIEYSLSSAGDILTTTPVRQTSFSIGRGHAFTVSDDGTRLAITDNAYLRMYTLSTPFNMDTAVLTNSYEEFRSSVVLFNTDGTKFYVYDEQTYLREYKIVSPFDITTIDYSSMYELVLPGHIQKSAFTFTFSHDGMCLYVTDPHTSENITEYRSDTPFELDSYALFNSTVLNDLNGEVIGEHFDMKIDSTGVYLYMIYNNSIKMYNTITQDNHNISNFILQPKPQYPYGTAIFGSVLMRVANVYASVTSTVSPDGGNFYITLIEEFKDDATVGRLYDVHKVMHYKLTTPNDVRTAVLDSEKQLVAPVIYDDPKGSSYYRSHNTIFSNNGSYMYHFTEHRSVTQYTLSTPWELSTAIQGVTIDFTTYETYPLISSPFFSADGTRMYTSVSSRDVLTYVLSTPWDINTMSLDTTTHMSHAGTVHGDGVYGGSSIGMFFSKAGDYIFLKTVTDEIGWFKFKLVTPWVLTPKFTDGVVAYSEGVIRAPADGNYPVDYYGKEDTNFAGISYGGCMSDEYCFLLTVRFVHTGDGTTSFSSVDVYKLPPGLRTVNEPRSINATNATYSRTYEVTTDAVGINNIKAVYEGHGTPTLTTSVELEGLTDIDTNGVTNTVNEFYHSEGVFTLEYNKVFKDGVDLQFSIDIPKNYTILKVNYAIEV